MNCIKNSKEKCENLAFKKCYGCENDPFSKINNDVNVKGER